MLDNICETYGAMSYPGDERLRTMTQAEIIANIERFRAERKEWKAKRIAEIEKKSH
jgi:hypothetical protein